MTEHKKKVTEPWKPSKVEKPVKVAKKAELKEHTARPKIAPQKPTVCEPEAIKEDVVDWQYVHPTFSTPIPPQTMPAKIATARDKRLYRMSKGRRGAK